MESVLWLLGYVVVMTLASRAFFLRAYETRETEVVALCVLIVAGIFGLMAISPLGMTGIVYGAIGVLLGATNFYDEILRKPGSIRDIRVQHEILLSLLMPILWLPFYLGAIMALRRSLRSS